MPWAAKEFQTKHLTDAQAAKAARIANAILRSGGDTIVTTATGIKKAKETAAAPWKTGTEQCDIGCIKVVKTINHDGWVERHELTKAFPDAEPFIMKIAYTPDGYYIGDPKDAKHIVEEKGIAPELRTPDSNVCSIGKSKDGRWWGWSHRAIAPFDTRDKAAQFAEEVSRITARMEKSMKISPSINARLRALASDDEEQHEQLGGSPEAARKWQGMLSIVRRAVRAYQAASLHNEDDHGVKGNAVGSSINSPTVVEKDGVVSIGFRLKTGGNFVMPTPAQAMTLKTWHKMMASSLKTANLNADFVGIFVRPFNASAIMIGAMFTVKGE
jgi:hypothetical protein